MKLLRLLALLLAPLPLAAQDLVIMAASSLKGPLDIAVVEFGGDIVVSYGASSAIARQVLLGAPADVVILANVDWMDVLAGEGALRGQSVDLLSNRLVLIGAVGAAPIALTPKGIGDVLGEDRLAIALTRAVPAGIYGRAALIRLGLWDSVSEHLAEVENVRVALALVRRGEVPLGLVYASDAVADQQVSVVAKIPDMAHPNIRYMGAVTAFSTHAAAAPFLAFLQTSDGRAPFLAAGFLPPVLEENQ